MNLTVLTTAASLLSRVLARARTLVPGLPVENSDRKVQVALLTNCAVRTAAELVLGFWPALRGQRPTGLSRRSRPAKAGAKGAQPPAWVQAQPARKQPA
jgi:hypothetical protein